MQESHYPEQNVQSKETLKLWNPYVAAVWAFFLFPGFGAWIHAKNWESLGRPEEAKKSMFWLYTGIGILLMVTLAEYKLGLLAPFGRLVYFGFFCAWYWPLGKLQVSLVKEGNLAYHKNSMFKMVTAWIGAGFIYMLTVFGLATSLEPTLEERLQSDSVSVVTEIVKEQLGGTSSCKKVVVITKISAGSYEAAASMDDGKVLKILIKVQGDQFFVEIPPQ